MQIDNLYTIKTVKGHIDLVYRYPDHKMYDASTFQIRKMHPDETILHVDNFIVTDVRKKLFVCTLLNFETKETVHLIIQESEQTMHTYSGTNMVNVISILNPESIDISIDSYKLIEISFMNVPSNQNARHPIITDKLADIFRFARKEKTDISLSHFAQLLDMEIPSHKGIPNEDYQYFSAVPDWKMKFLAHLNYYFLKMYKLIDEKENRSGREQFTNVLVPGEMAGLLRVPGAAEMSNLPVPEPYRAPMSISPRMENPQEFPIVRQAQPGEGMVYNPDLTGLMRVPSVREQAQQNILQSMRPQMQQQVQSGQTELVYDQSTQSYRPAMQLSPIRSSQSIRPSLQPVQAQQNIQQQNIQPIQSMRPQSIQEQMQAQQNIQQPSVRPLPTVQPMQSMRPQPVQSMQVPVQGQQNIQEGTTPEMLNLLIRNDSYKIMLSNLNRDLQMKPKTYYFTLGETPSAGIYIIINNESGNKIIRQYVPDQYDASWQRFENDRVTLSNDILTFQDIISKNNIESYIELFSSRRPLTITKRCVVFDFDCTLTYSNFFYLVHDPDINKYKQKFGHVLQQFGYQNMSEGELRSIVNLNVLNTPDKMRKFINIIFGGEKRFAQLKFFLNYLKRMGYDLYVSSLGQCSSITACLRYVGLEDLFTSINARGEGSCWKGTKDVYLEYLLNSGCKIIEYIDDDDTSHQIFMTKDRQNNLLAKHGANYSFDGANIGLQREGQGLTRDMMSKILDKTYMMSVDTDERLYSRSDEASIRYVQVGDIMRPRPKI